MDAISFTVRAGDVALLLGPNGIGKTTLLRTIAGMLRPGGGAVAIERVSSAPEDAEAEAPITSMMHVFGPGNGVKPTLTVEENLRFYQAFLAEREDEDAIADALATFGLEDLADLPVSVLSSGQQRRAGLARLLVAPRPIWLLDEPTHGLDAASREGLAGVLDRHADGGGIALVTTHVDLALRNPRRFHLGHEAPV